LNSEITFILTKNIGISKKLCWPCFSRRLVKNTFKIQLNLKLIKIYKMDCCYGTDIHKICSDENKNKSAIRPCIFSVSMHGFFHISITHTLSIYNRKLFQTIYWFHSIHTTKLQWVRFSFDPSVFFQLKFGFGLSSPYELPFLE